MALNFDPMRTAAVALDVLAAQRGTAGQVAARQAQRLARQLDAAVRGSAFYRRRLVRGGRAPDAAALASLPVVTRQELMGEFDAWVTDPRITLAALREFTADAQRIGDAFLGEYAVWESSGTSGEPGVFVHDAQALAVYDVLEALRRSPARPWQRLFDPMMLGERIAFVGATGGHFATVATVQRLRRLNPLLAGSMRNFSILQPPAALIGELNEFQPTIIATYPTAAVVLADALRAGALRVRLSELWTGGETLGAAARRHVEQAFGCVVRNSYGASEFLPIAWECTDGHLHVNSDWVILEAVDEHHRPVPPGTPSFTTLLTNLANQVQPLIRYDLGDQITVSAQACRCGSPLPAIDVRGRRDDALVMAGCDGHPVTLLPLALSTVIEDVAGVFDFQLRQRDARTLVLRVGSSGREGALALERCRKALLEFAQAQGVDRLTLVGETGHPAVRGRTGKAHRVLVPAVRRRIVAARPPRRAA